VRSLRSSHDVFEKLCDKTIKQGNEVTEGEAEVNRILRARNDDNDDVVEIDHC